MAVGEALGTGAGTRVYRAERDGRAYAVKVLLRDGGEGEAVAFAREAAMLASLDHPGLIAIHEAGSADGRPYLVMDLVQGRSLGDVLRDRPSAPGAVTGDETVTGEDAVTLGVPETLGLGLDLADVLAVVHAGGLVHRDLKPDNIMIRPDGRAMLIDFGLAGRVGPDVPGQGTDVAIGTFRYAAPEQTGMLNRAVDGRSDLYALGVVLFECLAGRPPFTAGDVGELLRQHLSAPPPDLHRLRPGLPPALVALVDRLLAKDPDDRYQTATGLRADLLRLQDGAEGFALGGEDGAGAGTATPFVGRAAELARLKDWWRLARTGSGRVGLVHGAPGAGKTRLLERFGDGGPAGVPLLLTGRCRPDDPAPLAVLREAVEGHLVRAAGEGLGARLRAAAGAGAGLLRPFSVAVADLIADPAETAEVGQEQLAEAVAEFLGGLAAEAGGMVLCLEDLRFSDEGTRRVLRRLAPIAADRPLLVLCTVTSSQSEVGEWAAEAWVRAENLIGLEPLPDADIATLVRAHLGAALEPAPGLLGTLVSRCAGNPMAAGEYVRSVIDAGLIRPYWGTWSLDETGLDALALPGDVMELVLRRLDDLGSTARHLLAVAAVAGSRFEAALVTEIAEVRTQEAEAAFGEAVTARLLEPVGDGVGGRYHFVHDRIRESLLAATAPHERRHWHQRCAEVLDAVGADTQDATYRTAHHYLDGVPAANPARTLAVVSAAGTLALAQSAPDEALGFLVRAESLAEEFSLPLDAAFHADLGTAASHAGDYELAQRHLNLALETETDRLRRAMLHRCMAKTHLLRWEGEESIQATQAGLTELGFGPSTHVVPLVLGSVARLAWGNVLGWVPLQWRQVHGEEAERHRLAVRLLIDRAAAAALSKSVLHAATATARELAHARRLGPGRAQAMVTSGMAMQATGTGRPVRGARLFARSVTMAQELGDPGLIAEMRFLEAIADDAVVPPGVGHGDSLREMLRGHGAWLETVDFINAANAIQEAYLISGRLQEVWAIRELAGQRSGERRQELGIHATTITARVVAMTGRAAEAARHLAQARAEAGDDPDLPRRIDLGIAGIHLAIEEGEYGAIFDDVVATWKAAGITPGRVFPLDRMFWVYQALGRLEQAWQARVARVARAAQSTETATETAAETAKETAAVTAAAEAVKELGGAAIGLTYGCYHQLAEAMLHLLRDDPAKAAELLGRLAGRVAGTGLDAPLLDHESARAWARVCRERGNETAAQRHARAAHDLAEQQGWRTRQRNVRAEFGDGTAWSSGPVSATGGTASSRLASRRSLDDPFERRRMQALYQVSVAAATARDARQVTIVALDEIVRIFGAERVFMFVEQDGELVPHYGRDDAGADLAELAGYGASLVETVFDTGRPLVVTGSEQGAALGSESTVVHGLRSIMIAPVAVKGRNLGIVYLDSRAAKGIFTETDVELLTAITNHVGLALETARTVQLERDVLAAQRARDTAQTLHGAMGVLAGTLEPGEVIGHLLAILCDSLPVERVLLLRRVSATDKLTVTSLHTGAQPVEDVLDDGGEALAALFDAPGPVHGSTVESPPPVPYRLLGPFAENTDGSRAARPAQAALRWLALPMRVRDEHQALVLAVCGGRACTDAETEIAAALVRQGQAALENAVLFQQVQELATRDPLTGLFNRRHFFALGARQTQLAHRHPQALAAIMIDIDHFKSVNDTHGHGVGDEVIREVARRLAAQARDTDIVCRYGGEEFAVLCPHTDASAAVEAAARLHAAVRAVPLSTAAGPLPVTVSVGVAGGEQVDLETLLDRADQALYRAKRSGRDQVTSWAGEGPGSAGPG